MASRSKAKRTNHSQTSKTPVVPRERLFKIGAFLLIAIGIAVLIYPFIPYLSYKLFPPSQENAASLIETPRKSGFLSFLPIIGDKIATSEEPPTGNRLIIPKIGVNIRIVEGENDRALLRGAWRIPQSSTPDKKGNTVITGHRFRFLPPNNTTFYLLDKMGVGDKFTIIWEDKEYQYQVKETKVVNPDQTEITAPSSQPIITLYTCTPLFTTKQRLVVTGELI